MSTFDHQTAWDELAEPSFNTLPANIHDLYQKVVSVSCDLRQGQDLNVAWPDGLRKEFEAVDSYTLAWSALVIYFYGHWAYKVSVTTETAGAPWKFANFADQVLRTRCGLPISRSGDAPRGQSFTIIEGVLRLCLSRHDEGTWREVGLGTPENLETASTIVAKEYDNCLGGSCFESACDDIKQALLPTGRLMRAFLDTEAAGYHIPEELNEHRRERRKAYTWAAATYESKGQTPPTLAEFEYLDFVPKTAEGRAYVFAQALGIPPSTVTITTVNHRLADKLGDFVTHRGKPVGSRHPFMIGTKHFDDGRINPRQSPCEHCGQAYSAHLCDTIASVAKYDIREHPDALLKFPDAAKPLAAAGVMGVMFETADKRRYVISTETPHNPRS